MFLINNFLYWFLVMVLSAMTIACSGQSHHTSTPDKLDEIENLTIFPGNPSPTSEINLEREISFGDTPEQPIGGLGGFDIDDVGRIYISDFQQNTLHVYESDDEYLTSIGRSGSGPGEYTVSPFPTVKSDQLLVLDPMRLLLNIYSIDDFELVRTINVNPINLGDFEGLLETSINQIMVLDEETFLVRMSTFIRGFPDKAGELKDDKKIYFYLMGDDGRLTQPLIEPVPLYEITGNAPEDFQNLGSMLRLPPSPQFFSTPLVTTSGNGDIYFAMSDHLLIRKYSRDGEYQYAFYYPFDHLKMNKDDAINAQGSVLAHIVEQNEVPDIWPAMDRMLVDDEGRIWIATIVEDLTIHEWWLLEESGELITTFEWPRSETIVTVKKDKMYTKQTDEETGLVQVVRYGIDMQEI